MLKYFKVTLGDNVKVVGENEAMTVAGEMVKVNGGGVPRIVPCDEQGNPLSEVPTEVPPPPPSAVTVTTHTKSAAPSPPKQFSDWGNTVVDQDAKKRIEATHAAIEAAGGPKIDTSKQFFETGTRMAAEGYATQAQREKEHREKILLRDAISQLQEGVSNEIRRDFQLSAKEIANLIDLEDGDLFIKDHLVREHALGGIVTRLKSPALSYLLGLRERINTNRMRPDADHKAIEQDAAKLAEILRYECLRNPDILYKLRMREFPQDIYAALSPTFGVADAPMVMEQILEEMPEDARGSWAYDQETTRWELRAETFTPTPVEEQAVGEPFSFFLSLRSSDAGNGRFTGLGGINIIKCLNASVFATKTGDLSRIHRGKILFDIEKMITGATKAAHILADAWGKNRKEELEIPTGVKISEAIPGFWRFLLTDRSSELQGVLKGRTDNHVQGLTKAFYDQRRNDEQVVRADLAQGFTRYIQDQPTVVRTEAEEAIGAWVVNQKPVKYLEKD